MFTWTSYAEKPETVPPVNRVPIGESQYYRAVTRRRRSPALSGIYYGGPVSNKRNFVPLPPQPYVDPGGEVGPSNFPPLQTVPYAGVVTGDKRGMGGTIAVQPSPYDMQDFILPKRGDPRFLGPPLQEGDNSFLGPRLPPSPANVVGVINTGGTNTPSDASTAASAGGLSSLFSGIPTTYLLIGGAVGLYFLMKKKR